MVQTKSGTQSASKKQDAPSKPPSEKRILEDGAELGPGLVEHGEGLGRHRVEDGPVPVEGTVILVAPERGTQ